MAVKAPYGPTSIFNRAGSFPSVPESTWPKSGGSNTNAVTSPDNLFSQNRSSSFLSPGANSGGELATTPLDITAPSPSTSESSTVFTDLDGDEEPQSAQPSEPPPQLPQVERNSQPVKSPSGNLKIDTTPLNPPKFDEEEPPQSVIHVPSGFGRFVPPGSIHRTASRLSQAHVPPRTNRSQSQSSSTVSGPSEPKQASTQQQSPPAPTSQPPQQQQQPISAPPIERPSTSHSEAAEPNSAISAVSQAISVAPSLAPSIAPTITSTAPSESTLRAEPLLSRLYGDHKYQTQNNAQVPTSPMSTTDVESTKDWATTPRAQTRQDVFQNSRPGSSLASITEGEDGDELSDHYTGDASIDEQDRPPWSVGSGKKQEKSGDALEVALSECWTLCNTLANLSHLHRERIFSNQSGKDDKQEKAWKACWKLCQTLYDTRRDGGVSATKATLALCRDFCQALFEVRVRTNDPSDSVLRVSFELNNHLFNTHDRGLPESFRERTLEFYVTLCHRLMKQKSNMGAESDSLLRTCWALAEILFSLRNSRRQGRKPEQELLCQAMQACWDLCDLFRSGWTQVRPDRSSPRPAQATFSQAFQTAKQAGHIEDPNVNKVTPETPTTVFDDSATISPDEAPQMPTISIMGHTIPKSISSRSVISAPAGQRPNTTQRISRSAAYNRNRWASINEALSEDEGQSQPTSAVTQSSMATSHVSMATSLASSQVTIRGTEDRSLTMLKALFIRAAVATGRGFSPDQRSGNRDTAYNSLPLFAKSLPDNAFGPQKWQRELLDHYKQTVAQDATFNSLGASFITIGLGIDPEKGREEIAGILKGLVQNTSGWGWLRDLFRYGYGTGIDEVLTNTDHSVTSPTGSKRSLVGGSSRSSVNGGRAFSLTNGVR